MKYSYAYKIKSLELYREGSWPETPAGTSQKEFRHMVRNWVRIAEACGLEALQSRTQNRAWTVAEKYELVAKVLAGGSIKGTAISAGINEGQLHRWVKRYKIEGYQGLAAQRKGRPPKEPSMKKKIVPEELTPAEREEMVRLKAENERLRAENAVIKKEIALREEKCAARLKAKRQRS